MSVHARRSRRLVLVALMVVLPLAAACARARDDDGPVVRRETADGQLPIDTEVMAYLSMARARHHEANLEEESDVPGAIAALDRLTHAPRPHPGALVPEIEEVLADTFAREAELHVRQGDVPKASDCVREGLTHAKGPSYFRGHLLEVGGIAEEARAAELLDAGHPEEAGAAKARAIDLLHQAIVVQERVVNDSLGGGTKRVGGSP